MTFEAMAKNISELERIASEFRADLHNQVSQEALRYLREIGFKDLKFEYARASGFNVHNNPGPNYVIGEVNTTPQIGKHGKGQKDKIIKELEKLENEHRATHKYYFVINEEMEQEVLNVITNDPKFNSINVVII